MDVIFLPCLQEAGVGKGEGGGGQQNSYYKQTRFVLLLEIVEKSLKMGNLFVLFLTFILE